MPNMPLPLVGQLGQFCDVRSKTFRVDITATVNGYSRYFTAILGRNSPRDVQVLSFYWSDPRSKREPQGKHWQGERDRLKVPRYSGATSEATDPREARGRSASPRQRQRRPRFAAFQHLRLRQQEYFSASPRSGAAGRSRSWRRRGHRPG